MNGQKIFSFGDILRFEWLDDILTYDNKKLENLMPTEEETQSLNQDKTELEKNLKLNNY